MTPTLHHLEWTHEGRFYRARVENGMWFVSVDGMEPRAVYPYRPDQNEAWLRLILQWAVSKLGPGPSW